MNLISDISLDDRTIQSLKQGEILLQTRPYMAWGGAFTVQVYLPLPRCQVWDKITNYPQWVNYFPAITQSKILTSGKDKSLYQAAAKNFLFLNVQVEIYLKVVETLHQNIQFQMIKGDFQEFTADLQLQDFLEGTRLIYSAQATPTLIIPSFLIEQALYLEVPVSLRQMRRVMCESSG